MPSKCSPNPFPEVLGAGGARGGVTNPQTPSRGSAVLLAVGPWVLSGWEFPGEQQTGKGVGRRKKVTPGLEVISRVAQGRSLVDVVWICGGRDEICLGVIVGLLPVSQVVSP